MRRVCQVSSIHKFLFPGELHLNIKTQCPVIFLKLGLACIPPPWISGKNLPFTFLYQLPFSIYHSLTPHPDSSNDWIYLEHLSHIFTQVWYNSSRSYFPLIWVSWGSSLTLEPTIQRQVHIKYYFTPHIFPHPVGYHYSIPKYLSNMLIHIYTQPLSYIQI